MLPLVQAPFDGGTLRARADTRGQVAGEGVLGMLLTGSGGRGGGRRRRRSALAAAVVLVAVTGGCVVDLGTLGGPLSTAADINDRGVVVGRANRAGAGAALHAFMKAPGEPMVDIGGSFVASDAVAVNEHGVGGGSADRHGERQQTVIWQPDGSSQVVEIGVSSSASDINDRGTIVGTAYLEAGSSRHAYLRDGETGEVTFLPFGTVASAINEAGDVVGTACLSPTVCRAALWEAGTYALVNLAGVDGRPSRRAHDINERGEIVGAGFGPMYDRAIFWQAGTHEPVAAGPSPEFTLGALNDEGHAVGTDGSEAILWDSATGRTTPLGQLRNGHYSLARAINDRGVAAGSASTGEPPPDDEAPAPYHAVTFAARPRG